MPNITPEEVARIKREACEQLINEFSDNAMLNPIEAKVMRAYVNREYPAPPKRVRAAVEAGLSDWRRTANGTWELRGGDGKIVQTGVVWCTEIAQMAALDAKADDEGMVTWEGLGTRAVEAAPNSEEAVAPHSPAPTPAQLCECGHERGDHGPKMWGCAHCPCTGYEARTPKSTDSFNSGESTPAFTPAPPESTETRVWLTWKRGASSAVAVLPEVAHWTQAQWDARYPWDAPHILLVPRASLDALRENWQQDRRSLLRDLHDTAGQRDALRLQLDEAREERDLARQCAKYESDVAGNAIADMEKASSGAEAALCFAEKATQEVRLELAVARLEGLGYRKMVGDLENERDRLQRACSDMLPAEMRRDLEHEVASLRTTLERAQYVADQQTLIAGEWEQRYETINAQLREATRKVTQEEFEKVKSAMEPFRWYGSVDPIARAAIAALGRTIEGEA